MGQAFADLIEAREGGEDGEEGLVIPEIIWPEGYLVPIDTAFEELKESIRAKFAALWADLKRQWEESGVGKAIADLKERWDAFYTETLVPLKKKLSEIWTTFRGWVEDAAWPWILKQWEGWKAWWTTNGPVIGARISEIKQSISSWLTENVWQWVVDEWDKWAAWWKEDGPVIVKACNKIVDEVRGAFEGLSTFLKERFGYDWEEHWKKNYRVLRWCFDKMKIIVSMGMLSLRNTISLAAYAITGDWEGFKRRMTQTTNETLDLVNQLTGGGLGRLMQKIENFKTLAGRIFDATASEIGGYLDQCWRNAVAAFSDLPRKISEAVLGSKWRIENMGHQLMDALRDAIYQKAEDIRNAFRNVINAAIEAALRALGMRSRSKVFYEMGLNVANAFTEGIDRLSNEPALSVEHMMSFPGVTAQAAVGPVGAGYAATQVVIHNNFGRDSVRSDQDIAGIAEAIQRSMTLRGTRRLM